MKKYTKHVISLFCSMMVLAGAVLCISVEPPRDLIRMKPYESTSKTGFSTNGDVIAARSAHAKALAYGNVGFAPIADWLFDQKANMKNLKPDADVSALQKVDLPYSWSKDATGLFRTVVTVPGTVNGFSVSGKSLTIAAEGAGNIDVFINGKKVKSFNGSGEVALDGVAAQGESIVLGVRVTEMTQRGRLGSVRFHAADLDGIKAPVDEILNKLESARMLFEQMPSKQKALLDAVMSVSREFEALKGVSDIEAAKAALAKIKTILAPVDEMTVSFPIFNQGPYLQNVKPDEMTIMWETRVPAPSAVYYGKGALDKEVSDPTPTLYHEIVIKGLEQQTEYKYLAVSGKQAGPESTFKTAIKKDTPFKFVVWSDNQSHPEVFEPIVDIMIKQNPDLGVSVGDVVGSGGDYSAWAREFFIPLRRLIIKMPFFYASGNHEYGGGFSCGKPVKWHDIFYSHPNEPAYYYAATYGNSRFIMLNQQEEAACNGYYPGSKQYEWLLKELESDEYKKADFHFMFLHKPPYSDCWSGGYYDGEPVLREHLVPLVEKYGVDIVFSGHTHDYERGQKPKPSGPYYIITGGAGGGLDDTQYKEWPHVDIYKFVHHFSMVEINGKHLKFSAIGQDGKVFDSFEINK